MSNLSIIRISRHPLTEEREAFLKSVYGDDLLVVTSDIRYGDDPVGAVKALIAQIESDHHCKVVAVEAQAPFPVTMKLVDARRALGVRLIRAQFMRNEFGRAIVVGQDERGRDVLKFSHYEELKRIVFDTQRLEA